MIDIIDQARDYIKQHLKECCEEMLEWQNTSILCNGHVRHAALIVSEFNKNYDLAIAEDIIKKEAMKFTINYHTF